MEMEVLKTQNGDGTSANAYNLLGGSSKIRE